MLSGHWPYWIQDQIANHPDELLRARLNHADNKQSLVVQDLKSLSNGLEGRSTNPVSLLLDNLQNPCADMGLNLPSMLTYKYNPEREIDHIVIGKGPAGGAWHRMDPNLRTLSLSAWMSLPGLDFNTWEQNSSKKLENPHTRSHTTTKTKSSLPPTTCTKCNEMHKNPQQKRSCPLNNNNNNNESENGALCCNCKCKKDKLRTNIIKHTDVTSRKNNEITSDEEKVLLKKSIPPRRNLSLKRENSKEVQTRALISRVAEYYESYVKEMNLEKYFLNNSIVTSVMPLINEVEGGIGKYKDARWSVCGFNRVTNKPFVYYCKNVVLANGSSDFANRLGIKGEGVATPWIKYELPHLESVLEKLNDNEKSSKSQSRKLENK